MATFRVDEFNLAPTGDSPATVLIKSKEYTTGAVAVDTDAILDRTKYIEVMADGDVYFELGENPTAAPASLLSQLLFSSSYRPAYPEKKTTQIISVVDK